MKPFWIVYIWWENHYDNNNNKFKNITKQSLQISKTTFLCIVHLSLGLLLKEGWTVSRPFRFLGRTFDTSGHTFLIFFFNSFSFAKASLNFDFHFIPKVITKGMTIRESRGPLSVFNRSLVKFFRQKNLERNLRDLDRKSYNFFS